MRSTLANTAYSLAGKSKDERILTLVQRMLDPEEQALRVEQARAASFMIRIELNDPNLRCRFRPDVKPLEGGRWCVEEWSEKSAAYVIVRVVQDPNGEYTEPDMFLVKQLKRSREAADDFFWNRNLDLPHVTQTW